MPRDQWLLTIELKDKKLLPEIKKILEWRKNHNETNKRTEIGVQRDSGEGISTF
jgi:hypothetical protein